MFSGGSYSLKVEAQTNVSEYDKDIDEMVNNTREHHFTDYVSFLL